VSLILVEILLPVFNDLSGQKLSFNLQTDFSAIFGFLCITIFIGFLSGIYPAFFLSKFQPVEVLKSKSGRVVGNAGLRKSLVTMQFVISIILILSTITVYSQLEYIKNKSLGFDKENVVEYKLNSSILQKSAQLIKNEMLSHPEVVSASLASAFPYNDEWWKTTAKREGGDKKDEKIIYTYEVDFDYLNTLKAKLAAGRDFSAKYSADSNSFIINESAVKEFGWSTPAEALGKRISWLGNDIDNPPTGPIIGIVKDFNFKSLHEKIGPAVFHITHDPFQIIAVRLQPNSTPAVLKYSENIFKKIDPSHPFEFSFLNEEINANYIQTEKLGDIFTVFSILAIFIACLGLFGLVFFTTEQRIKEIGIRKVLGASVTQIVYLLTKELITLVLIANIIAWPIAYFIMNKWLQVFVYRINIPIWAFLISGITAIAIALLTMSIHAIKTATANPIKSLKYE
jgi:putative ABC transport system permease protein